MTDVVQGFANAPVANSDGTTGIQLHVDTGTLYGAGFTNVAGAAGVTGTVGNHGGGNAIDDWSNIFFAFQGLANFGSDGAAHPTQDKPDPATLEHARRLLGDIFEAKVPLDLTAPATILPGQTITYTVDASSTGSATAFKIGVLATKPKASTQSFDLGDLTVGATAQRTYTYAVPADACPQILTSKVDATFNDFVGNPLASTDSAGTSVLDVTPPKIAVTLSPNALWSPSHKLESITATIVSTDECDPNPTVNRATNEAHLRSWARAVRLDVQLLRRSSTPVNVMPPPLDSS